MISGPPPLNRPQSPAPPPIHQRAPNPSSTVPTQLRRAERRAPPWNRRPAAPRAIATRAITSPRLSEARQALHTGPRPLRHRNRAESPPNSGKQPRSIHPRRRSSGSIDPPSAFVGRPRIFLCDLGARRRAPSSRTRTPTVPRRRTPPSTPPRSVSGQSKPSVRRCPTILSFCASARRPGPVLGTGTPCADEVCPSEPPPPSHPRP